MNYGSNAPGPGGRAGRTIQGLSILQVRPHHLGPVAPAQLGQTRHRALIIQGNNTPSNHDQRSEVGSIQRIRLTSLGSMDPQISDEPTLGNRQHFTYTKEQAPECMTRGPRSGRTSLTQQANPQPPSNCLRDQITDTKTNAVKIIGPTAPPCRLL
jgi:hypothetical protein